MEVTAKVFKSGNSLAVRLPDSLKIRVKELCVERGTDGDIILYDKRARERALKKRREEIAELLKIPPLTDDVQEGWPRV